MEVGPPAPATADSKGVRAPKVTKSAALSATASDCTRDFLRNLPSMRLPFS